MSHKTKPLLHLAGIPPLTLSVFWATASSLNPSIILKVSENIRGVFLTSLV